MKVKRAELDQMKKEELMRWKEKKHGMVGMRFLNKEEQARAERDKWMEHQEHEVEMLNISIRAEKLKSDWLVEEQRTPMEMFWKCRDRKQIERSWMGEKQPEEVTKILNRENKEDEK
jgi:hypothetical protein